jgi:hypothetical protein
MPGLVPGIHGTPTERQLLLNSRVFRSLLRLRHFRRSGNTTAGSLPRERPAGILTRDTSHNNASGTNSETSMVQPFRLTLPLLIALMGPAAAQTATTGAGAVNLSTIGAAPPAGTPTPSGAAGLPAIGATTPSATTPAPVTFTAPTGAGGSSSTATPAAPAGSTASPSATSPAASSRVPAWVLCPPSGASGLEPFLTGTNLSCAP